MGEVKVIVPKIGFNINTETMTYNNITFTMCDIGGKYSLLWRHYLKGVNGMIFVINSSDRDRI